jgi:hypothetical protein
MFDSHEFLRISLSFFVASAVRGKGIVLCLKVFFFAVRDFVVELVSVVEFLRLSVLKIPLKKGKFIFNGHKHLPSSWI